MKKFLIIFSIILSILLLPISSYANEVTILVNDTLLETDEPPQIVNDRTMLPMRAIFEELGATVTWMQEDEIIFATKDDTLITMQIGNEIMSVQKIGINENIAITLDSVPYVHNDRTFVPVRAIAEALNANVDWDGETYTVKITLK